MNRKSKGTTPDSGSPDSRGETAGRNNPGGGALLGELRHFLDAARAAPRDVVIVFLATAVIVTLSYYFGSRRFFRGIFFDALGNDRLYSLYEYLFWFGSEFVLAFLLLLVVIPVLHRRPIAEFGLGFGDWKFGLKISLLFYVVMLPILWIASDSAEFQLVYPHAQIVKNEWELFLIYEAAFMLYFTGWEFIWRGYMLFGLERPFGGGSAVLAQMLPFVILHNGKPIMETLGAIVAGVALGALALRTRSFWYCVLTHWLVMLTIDLFSTLRSRSGASGIGLDALARIVGLG